MELSVNKKQQGGAYRPQQKGEIDMKKVSFWGNRNQKVIYYILYVSTQKSKRQKWAGECEERIEIDNRINKYIENNDYVSAKIVCVCETGQYIEYIKSVK